MSKSELLRQRTKRNSIDILKYYRTLPNSEEARIIGRQLIRAATSVAANYRAACRARSKADFISKIGIVVKEADETAFWSELMLDAGISTAVNIQSLLNESNEILAIMAASQLTSKRNKQSRSKRQ